LFQCLVICFRLHFAKDATVINTASASVRQLVNQVFERVVYEDNASAAADGGTERTTGMGTLSLQILLHLVESWAPPTADTGGASGARSPHLRQPPSTLRAAAADAFMLFQVVRRARARTCACIGHMHGDQQ
jgi:hypothetical protein